MRRAMSRNDVADARLQGAVHTINVLIPFSVPFSVSIYHHASRELLSALVRFTARDKAAMENPMQEGYLSSAGSLFATAERAYVRAIQQAIHPTEAQDHSLTSVLLACATLESYINETLMLIPKYARSSRNPKRAEEFAEILREVESSRGSTRLKYLMGLAMLTGHPFDQGKAPYQDFELLFSIRDELMHGKLQTLSSDPHPLVRKLRSKGICAEDNGVKQSWHGIVFTPDAARWAYNTAANMINAIQAALFETAKEQDGVTPLKFWAGIKYDGIE